MIDFRRSEEPPKSLAKRRRKNGRPSFEMDVYERLRDDFFGKCYLCEGPAEPSFQVEHREPFAHFPERGWDWTNLFPAHADACNQRRPAWPEGGTLDPTAGNQVATRLRQWLRPSDDPMSIEAFFEPYESEDLQAANTANELTWLHGGRDRHSRSIRRCIHREWQQLEKARKATLEACDQFGPNSPAAIKARRRFLARLADDAPYAGLLRGYIAQRVVHDKPREWLGLQPLPSRI